MNIAQARERLEIERQSGNERKIRKLLIRIQQKISLPFACLIFGLVGSAVGNQRGGLLKHFLGCFHHLCIHLLFSLQKHCEKLGLINVSVFVYVCVGSVGASGQEMHSLNMKHFQIGDIGLTC